MSQLMPLLITAMLLLIPLVPAAVLYKVLTPKTRSARNAPAQQEAPSDHAEGEFDLGGMLPGKTKLKFNVVGSTATYVVLLIVSIFTHMRLSDLADKEADRIEQSMKDNQAWIVETPIGLKDASNRALPVEGGEMNQVRIELEPALTLASANSITFRVITSNGRFPTARFNLPGIGLRPVVLDLNDSAKVRRDHKTRRITGIQPVWIVLGQPYAPGASSPTASPPLGAANAVASSQGEPQ